VEVRVRLAVGLPRRGGYGLADRVILSGQDEERPADTVPHDIPI
jgi:hypothetical protein